MKRRSYGSSAADLELAHEAVKKARNFVWEGPSDESDPDKWAFTVSRHRDSGLLDESNFATISKDMEARFPDDVEVVHSSHWAVGWIDELAVRVFDEQGGITDAFHAIVDWKDKLEDYPIADEDDYSEREQNALIEHIASQIMFSGFTVDDPEDWAYRVAQWLSENGYDNELENIDDRGAYPSEEAVQEALRVLTQAVGALGEMVMSETADDGLRYWSVYAQRWVEVSPGGWIPVEELAAMSPADRAQAIDWIERTRQWQKR